ncbi:MAG: methyltransferase domain-containing protein [Micromonosporaceae bacterium]|nr:methyltransferase domain-containing protein [Micromonosporaceae bacterium]
MAAEDRATRWQRHWDKQSRTYDKVMGFWERRLFGDSREWICSQASGQVLEVAVGTGLNLPCYPGDVTVTGIDLSEQMLAIAGDRAAGLGRDVDLRHGNAHELPFDDDVFDTVVCTFSLCAIPDVERAVSEMRRVLRPGGRLLLADHVASSSRLARGVQRGLELVTIPIGGENFLRRPINQVRAAGFEIERSERFKLGLVERLVARLPERG